jgi:hypothetical protein
MGPFDATMGPFDAPMGPSTRRWAVRRTDRPFDATMGRSALSIGIDSDHDAGMPSATATTNFLAMPEQEDLESVRHALIRLLWSRDVWSSYEAALYHELTERELQLLASGCTRHSSSVGLRAGQ